MSADRLIGLRESLREFCLAEQVQGQQHIRPLHWHLAARLVIEGGFRPEEVSPRPPLRIVGRVRGRASRRLEFDPDVGQFSEQTVIGGLKTKQIDVVVAKDKVGPCLAISVKGTNNAFRNLTNRMEEAAGDCTNLHMSYPALVYGFLHVMRANREEEGFKAADTAVRRDGSISPGLIRYKEAIERLAGRHDLRNDVSRYEAVALALVETTDDRRGELLPDFPPRDSSVAIDDFFDTLYREYDLRFVYTAPALSSTTQRLTWDPQSPACATLPEARASR